jgi:hypothetical protein
VSGAQLCGRIGGTGILPDVCTKYARMLDREYRDRDA